MDLTQLRDLLREPIGNLKDRGTHQELPSICSRLGLPPPPPETGISKRDRMRASFDACPDDKLPHVAERYLEHFGTSASFRNEVQDLLWANTPGPAIPIRYRREVARALTPNDLYLEAKRFENLLTRLWVVESDYPWWTPGEADTSLRGQIEQHVLRKSDWSADVLFDKLGAYECSERRFCLFLEGLASSQVRPDEAAQRRFVKVVNEQLHRCGVELRETGDDGGYPSFTVVSIGVGNAGRPKNVIFASPLKPDLRFRDAINNEIEIVSNADKYLVYDRPIGPEGLKWRELQAWWAEREGGLTDEEAKNTLYRRLRDSIPTNSPPQQLLFWTFFKTFKPSIFDLPALLPEVWLYWDPKTVAERGRDALFRFRMDFLMLISPSVRVVIEVDGKQHYADDSGRADAAKYGAMMAADREMRLSGYEVYRFGGAELHGEKGQRVVKEFFEELFRRYGVRVGR